MFSFVISLKVFFYLCQISKLLFSASEEFSEDLWLQLKNLAPLQWINLIMQVIVYNWE